MEPPPARNVICLLTGRRQHISFEDFDPTLPVIVGFSEHHAKPQLENVGLETLLETATSVLYIHPDDAWLTTEEFGLPWDELAKGEPGVTFLIAPKSAPTGGFRNDGQVNSFCCSTRAFRQALQRPEASHAGGIMAFLVADESNRQPTDNVFSVYSGRTAAAPATEVDVTVVIPHRGDQARLAKCLEVSTTAYRGCRVCVGFDEPVTEVHLELARRFPDVQFFSVSPTHVGPFLIRQAIAELCGTEFVCFQDSDDLPCHRRIQAQYAMAKETGADVVGCHELRIDELGQKILIFRFPLDVNAALAPGSAHAQLHPTTLARRSMFLGGRGFSTRRRFASDTEFLFRSYFGSRMVNCDDFLYFRFRREGSLTTAPRTALRTRFRDHMRRIWMRDFDAVLKGELAIENSGIRIRHRFGKTYELTNISTGVRWIFDPLATGDSRVLPTR